MGGIGPAWVREHWQVDVAGEKVEATASLRPMYDQKMSGFCGEVR